MERTGSAPIYVQCNPLLDISAHVDEAFMKKYDVQPASAALCSEEQKPIYADLENQKDVCYIPGGSGLNTARVAKWMSGKKAPVTYVGCIADDKYGGILKSSAEKEGVTMNLEYTEKEATGTCAVCINGKERSLVANLAAANCISGKHIASPAVQASINGSKIFYLTGFTLTINVEYVLTVAKAAHAVGGLFMMNLSAPFIIQFFGEQLKQVLPYVDIIFSNEDEAAAFSEAQGFGTKDIKEIAQKAAALPHEGPKDRLVVFTQGKDATIFATKDKVEEVVVPAIAAEKIVDTNGAGDSFVGGFLAALAADKPIARCCEAGNYAAGVIIQHDGCTFPATPDFTI